MENTAEQTTTALAVPEAERTDLMVRRAPELVLREAQEAARALADVIGRKPKPVIFNGRRHIEAADWQLIAKFYGIAAKVVASTFVEFGKARGWEAHAVAIRVSDGQEISAADAMCLDDERNWSGKPLFQLRSMAQTRACAKALRNVLGWVVELAGYASTPAEEVQEMAQRQGKAVASGFITEAQRKRLFAIWRTAGHTDGAVQHWLLEIYGVAHSKEIPRNEYEAICKRLEDARPLSREVADPDYLPPEGEADRDS